MSHASANLFSTRLFVVVGFMLGAAIATFCKQLLEVTDAADLAWFAAGGMVIGSLLGWTVGRTLKSEPPFRLPGVCLLVGLWLIAGAVSLLAWPNRAEEGALNELRSAEKAADWLDDRLELDAEFYRDSYVVPDHGVHDEKELRQLRWEADRARRKLARAKAPPLALLNVTMGLLLLGIINSVIGSIGLVRAWIITPRPPIDSWRT